MQNRRNWKKKLGTCNRRTNQMEPNYVQIIGNGGDRNLGPSLLFSIGRRKCFFCYWNCFRFFVNLGEQSVRFCLEHKVKVQKHLNDLFVTQMRWKNIGGFADLISVVTERVLNMFSPPPLHHFLLANQICLYRLALSFLIVQEIFLCWFKWNPPKPWDPNFMWLGWTSKNLSLYSLLQVKQFYC